MTIRKNIKKLRRRSEQLQFFFSTGAPKSTVFFFRQKFVFWGFFAKNVWVSKIAVFFLPVPEKKNNFSTVSKSRIFFYFYVECLLQKVRYCSIFTWNAVSKSRIYFYLLRKMLSKSLIFFYFYVKCCFKKSNIFLFLHEMLFQKVEYFSIFTLNACFKKSNIFLFLREMLFQKVEYFSIIT